MIFELEDYKDEDFFPSRIKAYCMHCKTEEEANNFLSFLNSKGRSWMGGMSYLSMNMWNEKKENIVYYFNEGTYGDYDDAVKNDCTILEWSNFMKNTEENTVEEKKGSKGFVKEIFKMLGIAPDEPFTIREDSYKLYYKLTKELEVIVSQNIDFTEKRFSGYYNFYSFIFGEATIVKIPKFTEKEKKAIDYARACGANWLTKDDDGIIYAYSKRPHKKGQPGTWWPGNDEDICFEIGMDLSFLSSTDALPFCIGDENE